jgi:hypothetical protein
LSLFFALEFFAAPAFSATASLFQAWKRIAAVPTILKLTGVRLLVLNVEVGRVGDGREGRR